MEIEFRPLARDDLEQLDAWLQREHVARWWNEEMTPARVEETYVPRIEGREPVRMFVIGLDRRDAGFVQTYKVADYPESWPFDVRNRRSVRAFEKAGFAVVGTMDVSGAPALQAVVRLER